jgi:hypothetical protein
VNRVAVVWCALALVAPVARAAQPEVVTVPADQAAGLTIAAVEAGEAPRASDALGTVLDPLPFVQAAHARATARTAAAIAEREETRVEALARADHNASLRDVEAARLAAARARDDRAAAEAQAIGLWGAEALAQPDLDAFVERLARGAAALARLDVEDASLVGARAWVTASALGGAERAVRLLGTAPSVDPALQARAVVVALETDPLPVGAALVGRVESAEVVRGVWLPASAIVWHDAASFVFLARSATEFERRAVALASARRPGFTLADGVAPGDRIVVSGAQQLLSAQLVGGAPEE